MPRSESYSPETATNQSPVYPPRSDSILQDHLASKSLSQNLKKLGDLLAAGSLDQAEPLLAKFIALLQGLSKAHPEHEKMIGDLLQEATAIKDRFEVLAA